MKYPQAKYWILTIPHAHYTPYLPPNCGYIRGQLERGEGCGVDNIQCNSSGMARQLRVDGKRTECCLATCQSKYTELGEMDCDCGDGPNVVAPSGRSGRTSPTPNEEVLRGGFLHWQIVVCFTHKIRLRGVREVFGPFHCEPTKSTAAMDYVWKTDTAVEGTRFELGSLPVGRSTDLDWAGIKHHAVNGRLDDIPPDIFVRNYNSLKRIMQDNLQPLAVERTVKVYWGKTGVGKSRRAWSEAGLDAFPKDPRSKFWDGYRGHKHVVIDEFRGDIDIAHCLRWFDRYPVIVEVKGTSVVFQAECIWITSNLDPNDWYPTLDRDTRDAFLRRLIIEEIVGTQ